MKKQMSNMVDFKMRNFIKLACHKNLIHLLKI